MSSGKKDSYRKWKMIIIEHSIAGLVLICKLYLLASYLPFQIMLSNAGFYYPENGISPTPLSIVFLLLSPNRRHQRGTGGRKEVWGLDFNSGYSRSSEVGAKGWWLPDQRNDQFLDFRLTHILLILLWFLQQSYNKLHVFLPPRILE